jgi:hypothetical protein
MATNPLKRAKQLYRFYTSEGNKHQLDMARRMFFEHCAKYKIKVEDIDTNLQKRSFATKNKDFEVILSYCIMSVNPLAKIDKQKKQYLVNLDDEDVVEVETKANFFYMVFLKEKEILLTAFLNKHNPYFQPDEYAIQKCKDAEKKDGKDAFEEAKEFAAKQKREEEAAKLKDKTPTKDEADAMIKGLQEQQMFNSKAALYQKLLGNVKYTRANRTLNKK